uniref:Uncharacterized protein n=1 Tax=Arundo donax TaxID=35708 RepID=A0A0A9A1C0_ARUDO
MACKTTKIQSIHSSSKTLLARRKVTTSRSTTMTLAGSMSHFSVFNGQCHLLHLKLSLPLHGLQALLHSNLQLVFLVLYLPTKATTHLLHLTEGRTAKQIMDTDGRAPKSVFRSTFLKLGTTNFHMSSHEFGTHYRTKSLPPNPTTLNP